MSAPIAWQWEGDVMRPLRRFTADANTRFVVGERYLMDPIDEVQSARDRAFHASLRDLWANLPERFDGQFPSYDDFRGHCLVKCRYALIQRIPCGTPKVAREVAPGISAVKRKGYSIINIQGSVVHVIQAMSQAIRGGDMTRDQRYQSYKDVLDYAASLVGTTAEDAAENARRVA